MPTKEIKKTPKKYFYTIENTYDESGRRQISAIFFSLKAAKEALPNYSDWWCCEKGGSGVIYRCEEGAPFYKRKAVYAKPARNL